MPIVKNIIDQHADEASFNWLIRSRAVEKPHYKLEDLAELDGFIQAHFDGLRIAGEEGWQICRKAMSIKEPGEIFTAGVLAFEALITERMDAVLAAVESDDALQRALISALGWLDFDTVKGPVQNMLSAEDSFLRYIGLGAHAIHRRIPAVGLNQFVEDDDPLVRARALKAAGELRQSNVKSALLAHLQEEDEKCRFYAAWSSALLGEVAPFEVLKSLAANSSTYAREACHLVVRVLGVADAAEWLGGLYHQEETLHTAIHGYGALGVPEAIPRVIEVMSIPRVTRLAGEAVAMITGLDIGYEDLDGEPPEGFAPDVYEEPEDGQEEADEAENLPWPAPELVEKWWQTHQDEYKKGTRYLCGELISRTHCSEVLINGYQRQRKAAALELALATPDQPLFEARAPGFLQQHLLGVSGYSV